MVQPGGSTATSPPLPSAPAGSSKRPARRAPRYYAMPGPPAGRAPPPRADCPARVSAPLWAGSRTATQATAAGPQLLSNCGGEQGCEVSPPPPSTSPDAILSPPEQDLATSETGVWLRRSGSGPAPTEKKDPAPPRPFPQSPELRPGAAEPARCEQLASCCVSGSSRPSRFLPPA
ncbi:predicted GPI-anchored protein 58 [Vombatus ursinus]|uniref:predicted GPI-anchored protein 58 n=1 Tax=Vombatus ursinus TaxID=29139 RepID=UPI000FFD904F|nr:predicted GPI-anchored protein 58 [Vombatus ursinus]